MAEEEKQKGMQTKLFFKGIEKGRKMFGELDRIGKAGMFDLDKEEDDIEDEHDLDIYGVEDDGDFLDDETEEDEEELELDEDDEEEEDDEELEEAFDSEDDLITIHSRRRFKGMRPEEIRDIMLKAIEGRVNGAEEIIAKMKEDGFLDEIKRVMEGGKKKDKKDA